MQRQKQLTEWLKGQFPDTPFDLAPASADASFRRYFRATFPGRTLIVMDAPPQHENCRPFLHIAQLFEDAGTHVPHVYAQDLEQGFLLLSDLGNTTYLQALCGGVAACAETAQRASVWRRPLYWGQQRGLAEVLAPGGCAHRPPPCGGNTSNARELYGAATDALIAIQLASRENELPPYDEALLLREMRLFPEWYIAKHLQTTLDDKQTAMLEATFQRIIQNNLAQPHVYVHRDYHSRNLMYVESLSPSSSPARGAPPDARLSGGLGAVPHKGERDADSLRELLFNPGILDFQDAVYGPITYDLASLFKDAYIHWEEADVLDWLIRYWEKAHKAGLPVHTDFSEFFRDYEWMGVQRHLKVLGIFARLYRRDGKDGYLKDMPLVMDYLRRACERYIDLKPLLRLLDQLEARKPEVGFTF